jgi:hypothetical protein
MKIAPLAVLAAGFAWLLAAEASATTVIRLELPEMVDASARIVVGTVSGSETVWVGRELFTRYTVAVEETLLGDGQSTVSVLVPGGIDRSRRVPIGMAVAGAPAMMTGERAVLLLAPIDHPAVRGDLQIVGFNQGRFPVVNGRVTAAQATAGATSRTAASAEPLSALRTRLHGLVQKRGQARAAGAPRLRRLQ